MKVPWKKAKTRPDGGVRTLTAAEQIAELQVELKRCKRENLGLEGRHNQVVRDLNSGYSDALEWVYTVDDGAAASTAAAQQIVDLQAELEKCKREKIEREERHNQVVRDLKRSYSDAFRWAYSVRSIPRCHWLLKGHTEEYTDAIEGLLNAFKLIIKDLRTGTAGARISVKFDLQDDDDHRVTAAHDDVLMPYWKELANALVHWSEYHADEETLEVAIICIETPDAVLNVLRPAIKRSSVSYVSFVSDGTPKPWKLAEFIEDIIETNHKVTSVGFGSVMLTNEEWASICNAIRMRNVQASIMDYFQLTDCSVDGVNTEVLKGILTSNAVEADLGYNGMASVEAPIIAECLTSNPALARLFLCGNRFGDNDATVLANSLSSNTNLRVLNIEQNNIEEEGRLALLRAIFDVTSLAACASSNHACQVVGLEQDISDLNCYVEVAYNKWDKIFAMLALSSKHSFINTTLLSEVPASLMPVLLYRAYDQFEEGNSPVTDLYLELTGARRSQKHDVWDNLGHTRPLNCMYELIRSWVVPSIFV